MSEKSSYPNGRDFCSYRRFIAAAQKAGRRYGYGIDMETLSLGLFVEIPVLLPSGRLSRKHKFPSLMRATGPMRGESTVIRWK